MSILDLANSSGRWVERNLKAKPELFSFLTDSTSKLNNWNYTIVTRLIWFFTGRADFPKCEVCGKEFGKFENIKLPRMYRRTCSAECANKLNAFSNILTCRERYGIDNVFQLESVKNKSGNTKELLYGDRNYNNEESRKLTFLSKYGTENNMQSDRGIAEYKEAMHKKYGVDFPLQSEVCLNNMHETCMLKYGRSDVSTPETVYKRKQTCLDLYGVETPMQSPAIRRMAQKRYTYDNRTFDSAAELSFYIWLKDGNRSFTYQPDISFEYEYNGKTHKYMPDFLLDGKLIEIKGDQFLKSDGTWRNPYDHIMDGIYEAKHQCCILNNVQIMYSSEYSKYIGYCQNKFNDKKWYNKFKNS